MTATTTLQQFFRPQETQRPATASIGAGQFILKSSSAQVATLVQAGCGGCWPSLEASGWMPKDGGVGRQTGKTDKDKEKSPQSTRRASRHKRTRYVNSASLTTTTRLLPRDEGFNSHQLQQEHTLTRCSACSTGMTLRVSAVRFSRDSCTAATFASLAADGALVCNSARGRARAVVGWARKGRSGTPADSALSALVVFSTPETGMWHVVW